MIIHTVIILHAPLSLSLPWSSVRVSDCAAVSYWSVLTQSGRSEDSSGNLINWPSIDAITENVWFSCRQCLGLPATSLEWELTCVGKCAGTQRYLHIGPFISRRKERRRKHYFVYYFLLNIQFRHRLCLPSLMYNRGTNMWEKV